MSTSCMLKYLMNRDLALGMVDMEQGKIRGSISFFQRQYLRKILPEEIVPTCPYRCSLYMGKRFRSGVFRKSSEACSHYGS